MNPFIWVLIIILMTLDALRELAGASSILGWLLTLV
ncbi:KPN_01571 family protein [Shigella flexneri]